MWLKKCKEKPNKSKKGCNSKQMKERECYSEDWAQVLQPRPGFIIKLLKHPKLKHTHRHIHILYMHPHLHKTGQSTMSLSLQKKTQVHQPLKLRQKGEPVSLQNHKAKQTH